MHVPINFKFPNNISEWQMGFNSAFKGLTFMDDYAGTFEDTRTDVTRRTASAAGSLNYLNCRLFSSYKLHITEDLSNIYNTVLDVARDLHGRSVCRHEATHGHCSVLVV